MNAEKRKHLLRTLDSIRRQLGPFTKLQHEPYALNDAGIARPLVALVGILEEVLKDEEPK